MFNAYYWFSGTLPILLHRIEIIQMSKAIIFKNEINLNFTGGYLKVPLEPSLRLDGTESVFVYFILPDTLPHSVSRQLTWITPKIAHNKIETDFMFIIRANLLHMNSILQLAKRIWVISKLHEIQCQRILSMYRREWIENISDVIHNESFLFIFAESIMKVNKSKV